MKKLSSWYNRTHKIFQFQTTGGYDTFGTFRKSKNGKRIQHKRSRRQLQHKRSRRQLQHEKFYEGFEEFIENQRR